MPPDDAPPKPGQSFRPKARRPRGLEDRRGRRLAREREVIAKVSAVYQAWGFEALDTPALEFADALGKFLPDQDRPNEGVFAFPDDDEQWLSLRYDLTAPLARYVAENFDALPKPFRRWAAGPVWRNEKPGPGRFREFWQCDADTVGAPGPAADAEMIAMAGAALAAVGAPGVVLKINSRKLMDGVLADAGVGETGQKLSVLRAVDKLDRVGVAGVRELLGPGRRDPSGDFTKGAGLAGAAIDAVIALISMNAANERGVFLNQLANAVSGRGGEETLRDFAVIDAVLSRLGVGGATARFDVSVVRGLEYYTGAVFEAELIGGADAAGKPLSLGAVGGGGRYDELIARFRGEAIPATGFSIGVSRLVAAREAAEAGDDSTDGPVVILALEPDFIADYFQMAAQLRAGGVPAEVYLGAAGMRAQMKYADKRGAPIAVIVGGDERAKGVVTVKDLKLGDALSKTIADNEAWRKGRPAQIEAPRAEWIAAVLKMRADQGG